MAIEYRDERETVRPSARIAAPPDGRAPDSPGDLGGSSKKDTLKRTFKEFSADNMTDWAAALTYYAVLAVFPAIIALVSIIGLVGGPRPPTRCWRTSASWHRDRPRTS